MDSSFQYLFRIGMGLLLAVAGPAVARGQTAAVENAGVREIRVGMAVVVAADGSVDSVVPDPDTPEPLKAALVKRALTWRYSVPQWQGHAVSLSTRQSLQLQLWPTTVGGFAIRIKGPAFAFDPDPRYAWPHFDYPERQERHRTEAHFRYVMRIETDGRVVDVRRVYPEGPLHGGKATLDAVAQHTLETWIRRPVIANGEVVSCWFSFGVSFVAGSSQPDQTPGAKKNPETPWCPSTAVKTKIAGTLL